MQVELTPEQVDVLARQRVDQLMKERMTEIGRKGGKVTGLKGAALLSPDERKALGQRLAKARQEARKKRVDMETCLP